MAHQDSAQKYDCLLFDVDDTLYPLSSGLSKECTKNIEEYMINELGIEETEVTQMNRVLYKQYGTSMAGLKAIGYNFDNDDYHSYVHGRLPYEKLKPDYTLRNLLLSSPLRKVIFSNANEEHVAKVLSKLGLEDCFDDIICFETINPDHKTQPSRNDEELNHKEKRVILDVLKDSGNSQLPATPILCKPFEEAFKMAFSLANINPQRTVFFDDSICNIQTGKRMGLHTVLVGTQERINGADNSLESIHNMKEARPQLWEEANKMIEAARNIPTGIAIETTLTA